MSDGVMPFAVVLSSTASTSGFRTGVFRSVGFGTLPLQRRTDLGVVSRLGTFSERGLKPRCPLTLSLVGVVGAKRFGVVP